MPIINIRDTIQGSVTPDGSGFGYMTKQINLEDGFRYDMLSVDVFNDNLEMPLKTDAGYEPNVAYQLYVSPYPMQQIGGEWGFGGTGPIAFFPGGGQSAGEPNVLYKEIGLTGIVANNNQQSNKIWKARFPNDNVAATPTSKWFSPHVYVTVMVWNVPDIPLNINFSVFMRVDKKKSSAASSAMGKYAEFLDSQIKKLTDTAVVYPADRIEGYTFPMWKYGGVRPELMISGTTALRYYNRVASNANQDMVDLGTLQGAFKSAVTMVGYDQAFGDAANNLPEWITLMDVEGVTAGTIRQYPPPRKFADNGNTLML